MPKAAPSRALSIRTSRVYLISASCRTGQPISSWTLCLTRTESRARSRTSLRTSSRTPIACAGSSRSHPRLTASTQKESYTATSRRRTSFSTRRTMPCLSTSGSRDTNTDASSARSASRRRSSRVMRSRRVGSSWGQAAISRRKSGRAERRARHPMSMRSVSCSSAS